MNGVSFDILLPITLQGVNFLHRKSQNIIYIHLTNFINKIIVAQAYGRTHHGFSDVPAA